MWANRGGVGKPSIAQVVPKKGPPKSLFIMSPEALRSELLHSASVPEIRELDIH